MNPTSEKSPYYPAWIGSTRQDLPEMRAAIENRNFTKMGELMEFSCLKMHGTMLSAQGEEARVAAALESAGYKTVKPDAESDDSSPRSDRNGMPINRVQKPEERLIVVTEKDEIVRFLPRSKCHAGEGLLHRAFSIHILNDQNQILLQRRSDRKQLWPLFWSNSCCSHPRAGEITIQAAERRLREELGITTRLEFLYKFRYQARYDDTGSENEMCSVYLGRSNGPVIANASEVAEWRFVDPEILDAEIRDYPERFTPWFIMQWRELQQRVFVENEHKRIKQFSPPRHKGTNFNLTIFFFLS